MGCDIHLYTEYRKKDSDYKKWQSLGGRVNPGRNYLMFGIMRRGVRTEPTFSIKGKGLPEDIGYYAQLDNRLFISEKHPEGEGNCSLEQAKRWETDGNKIINDRDGKPTWVEHPDWHSHSWLSLNEFQQAIDHYNKEAVPHWVLPEYEAVLASMKRLDELGYETRIVFWFDN